MILFFDVVTGMPSRKSHLLPAAVSSLESVTASFGSKVEVWLAPKVINWQEEQEGACLVITAIPAGIPAAESRLERILAQSAAVNGAATWRCSQPIG